MYTEITYNQAIKQHASLKALGISEVYLSRDNEVRPWAHVTKVEPGGSHRLEIATSVNFTAVDPKTKLQFRWSEDIEDRRANGKGHYEIAANHCREIMAKLPVKAKATFASYLVDCARKVQAKGLEWQGYADRQFRDAAIMATLATEVTA